MGFQKEMYMQHRRGQCRQNRRRGTVNRPGCRRAGLLHGLTKKDNDYQARRISHGLFGFMENELRPEGIRNNESTRENNFYEAEGKKKSVAQKQTVKVDVNRCKGCGICAEKCRAGAISITDVAVVDASLCTACGACVSACPSGALIMLSR